MHKEETTFYELSPCPLPWLSLSNVGDVFLRVLTCARGLPVKDGSDACAVGAVPVHVQPGGQEDAVLHRDGAMGEGRNQELVPACEKRKEKRCSQGHTNKSSRVEASTNLHGAG